MIDDKTLQINNLSYTNKDFQTIYPELIELFKKLTTKYDPEATNESDPLLVFIKLLGFMGDKLNYNSDMNAQQTHLPSASEESAFRDIVETQGYNMKYYRSATTTISMQYNGVIQPSQSITFKRFDTQFKDSDGTTTYSLLNDLVIEERNKAFSQNIIEGTFVDLSINGNTIIQLNNLDSNNRLFLPTTLIAENGIFVANVNNSVDWDEWKSTDNLNLHLPKEKYFKFGFDSGKGLPYIQFPSDIIELIGNGLCVKYLLTNGAGGNISAKKLTELYNPAPDSLTFDKSEDKVVVEDENTNANLLLISNTAAATNGEDKESLNDAYFNFKKTIGTFDTLINCRDFANYLYNYLRASGYPLVSNSQVSDRRIDVNYSVPIISYSDGGAKTIYKFRQEEEIGGNAITPFDLVLYPLQQVDNINSDSLYARTFSISSDISDIPAIFTDVQSVDHTFLNPTKLGNSGDMCNYLYKNKYELNARITTTRKVSEYERYEIINQVKQALYDAFNSRKIEYGKELAYDDILETIQNSNDLIRNISLDEPNVVTYVLKGNGIEYKLLGETSQGYETNPNKEYLYMIARNILAGKLSIYSYDTRFNYIYGQTDSQIDENILSVDPQLVIKNGAFTGNNGDSTPKYYTLNDNQVVQLFSPNYAIDFTAVAGVNYNFTGNNGNKIPKNTTYSLISGDEFILQATDSTQTAKKYVYKNVSSVCTKETYINGSEIPQSIQKLDEIVIKPNLDIEQGVNGYAKPITIDGVSYRTLGSTDEISFLNKVKTTITNNTSLAKVVKMYWSVDNANNQLFDYERGITTRILSENEYVIYTDDAMSSIEMFGAGTKLSTNFKSNNDWIMDKSNLISLDTLDNTNLSTYASINWQNISFSMGNEFSIEEQTIITLASGDSFHIDGGFVGNLTSELQSLAQGENPIKFNYKLEGDVDATTIDANVADTSWQIRTRLDLNVGPGLVQKVVSEEDIYDETITLNSDTDNPSTITNKCLLSNVLLQRSGNTPLLVDTNILSLDMYSYVESKPTLDTEDIDLNDDNSILISFDKYGSKTKLVLVVPVSQNNSIVSLYFTKGFDSDDVSVEIDGDGSITNLNNNQESNNDGIVEGINTLTLVGTTFTKLTITITKGATSVGSLSILPLKVKLGYNSVLNLDDGEDAKLIDIIDDLIHIDESETNEFFYAYDVPNDKIIDVLDMKDPSSLWETNNVVNKFTLAQIDFNEDKTYIDIIKSSRR